MLNFRSIFLMYMYYLVFLGSVRSGSSSLNLELEPELEPAHFAVFRTRTYNTWTRTKPEPMILELEPNPNLWYLNSNRTRTYDTWTRTEPELYLWVQFGFSSKFMNKFGFNHVIWQILHALKLLNKKNFFW